MLCTKPKPYGRGGDPSYPPLRHRCLVLPGEASTLQGLVARRSLLKHTEPSPSKVALKTEID